MPTRPSVKYYDVHNYGKANTAVNTIEAYDQWAIIHYHKFDQEEDHYEVWVERRSYGSWDSQREAGDIVDEAIKKFMAGQKDWS